MTIISEDSFEQKAGELGLVSVASKIYMLPDYGVIFKYVADVQNQTWYIETIGLMPEELEMKLYETFSVYNQIIMMEKVL